MDFAQFKPKTIKDENLKKFINILSDICTKYRSINSPKYGAYGKAILSITMLGSTEFKKRMNKGQKVPYFGPKLTALYQEFVKTGKCKLSKQIDLIIENEKKTIKKKENIETQLKTLRKELNSLKKDLQENIDRPRISKKLSDEITDKKESMKKLKKKLYQMSETDISDNSMIEFSELMLILQERINEIK